MSRPRSWTDWKAAVTALVRQTAGTLELYRHPSTPIDQDAFDASLRSIADALAQCDAAAALVGSEAERVAVSRTLYRLQKDAVRWAEWVRATGSALRLDDPNAVHQWHAQAMLPVDRLGLVLRGRDIGLEMDERALRLTPTTETPKAETPEWNGTERVLRFRGQECKRFRRPAPDQETVLRTFEEDRWPGGIDDPLTPGKLANAVESLNDRLKHIRFELNGTGDGVRWYPV
jgi:hypothetical protein